MKKANHCSFNGKSVLLKTLTKLHFKLIFNNFTIRKKEEDIHHLTFNLKTCVI